MFRRLIPVLLLVVGVASAGACTQSKDAGGRPPRAATTTTTPTPTTDPAQSPLSIAEEVDARRPVPGPRAEWPTVSPDDAGFSADALDVLAAYAESQGSLCLAITKDGKRVDHRDFGSSTPTTPHDAWSITKSIASALVGQAVERDELDIDQRVTTWVPAWEGTRSATATVEDLLQMDSGRQTRPETPSDALALAMAPDIDRAAIDWPADADPNQAFGYSNMGAQILDPILHAVTGEDVAALTKRDLLDPLGMADSTMMHDATGHTATFAGLTSTCDDLARFGLLYLNGGSWNGTQIVPRDWVLASLGPTPNRATYGYLWWLEPANGDLPNVFEARGAGGQRVTVIPSLGIVATTMMPFVNVSTYPNEFATRVLDTLDR